MDGLSFDVIGNRVILDNLDGLEAKVQAKVQVAMVQAAPVGVEVAKSLARVDTGRMRDGVFAEVRDGQIILGDDAPETIYNELGTHKMSAQPFLVPGALASGDALVKNLEGML